MHKTLTALALAAALVAAPGIAFAQHHHGGHHGGYHGHGGYYGGGVAAGLAAGAILGAMAAEGGYYYGPDYYGPGPYYGYYYGPGYYGGPYAYEPPPAYVRPLPRPGGQCWIETDKDRGYGYYGPCR
jgi:hypothetical protein